MDKIKIMFIENFDKIYRFPLHTPYWAYTITKDEMKVQHNYYAIRLTPTVLNNKSKHFSVLIGKFEDHIKCGIYSDSHLHALEVFELSRYDLKSIDTFKDCLAAKIQNYE
jgi:hypothetical protein